jgi:hypothetical protein
LGERRGEGRAAHPFRIAPFRRARRKFLRPAAQPPRTLPPAPRLPAVPATTGEKSTEAAAPNDR